MTRSGSDQWRNRRTSGRRSGIFAALIGHAEDGARSEISWSELKSEVSRLQRALRAAGVCKGDRVAGVLPNIPETVLAMLAVSSLGAVWSSWSPDFGAQTLLDRLGQIRPKVIFTVPAYHYNGKTHLCLDKLRDLEGKLDDCRHLATIPNAGESGVADGAVTLEAFCAPHAPAALTFEPMGFDDPLFILFSSGTTGLPKCIIHKTGGVLLQHLKEHQLQGDNHPGDRLFYYTACRWMMWNWQASALASGAVLVLFSTGSPISPVYSGQAQKRQLGMAVDVIDGAGTPVRGGSGELVSRGSHLSMPLGFLNDPDRAQYRSSYFAAHARLWTQGDLVALTAEGGMVFYGRSDATLNPGGVRIGTAELYRQVERISPGLSPTGRRV